MYIYPSLARVCRCVTTNFLFLFVVRHIFSNLFRFPENEVTQQQQQQQQEQRRNARGFSFSLSRGYSLFRATTNSAPVFEREKEKKTKTKKKRRERGRREIRKSVLVTRRRRQKICDSGRPHHQHHFRSARSARVLRVDRLSAHF